MNDNSIIISYLQFKQVRGKKRHQNFFRGISDLPITVIHVEVDFKFSLAPLSRHDLIFEPRKQGITQYLGSTSVTFAAPAR